MNRRQLLKTILKYSARAGLVAFIAIIVINFLKKEIVAINKSVVEQKDLAAILERRSATLSQLKSDYDRVDGSEEKILGAMPPADNILEFVAALESLGLKNSIEQTLSFNTPSGSEISYSITLNGNIFSLINYLKDFEKLPYLTSISSVNLVSQGDWEANSSIYLSAKLHIK